MQRNTRQKTALTMASGGVISITLIRFYVEISTDFCHMYFGKSRPNFEIHKTKNRCMKIRMLIEKIFYPFCECDINLMGIPGGEILIGIFSFIH